MSSLTPWEFFARLGCIILLAIIIGIVVAIAMRDSITLFKNWRMKHKNRDTK